MTTHELARRLLALPDVPVYVQGYEAGLRDATEPEMAKVVRNYREEPPSYFGPHEECSFFTCEGEEEGVILRR